MASKHQKIRYRAHKRSRKQKVKYIQINPALHEWHNNHEDVDARTTFNEERNEGSTK